MEAETLNRATVRITFSVDEAKAVAKFVRLGLPDVKAHVSACRAAADKIADCFHAEQAKFKTCRDFGNERAARAHQHHMANYVKEWDTAAGEADAADKAVERACFLRDELEVFVADATGLNEWAKKGGAR